MSQLRSRISLPRRPSVRELVESFRARPRSERIAFAVLAGLLLVGIVLRAWMWLAVRPGFIGYPDSESYIGIASDIIYGDPFLSTSFPRGYPWFLAALNTVAAKPALVTLVQHGLGVAGALLLYAAARRVGAPVWAAVIPAGVHLLFGGQIFVEHTYLSEALFTFLVPAVLYFAVRSLSSDSLGWPAVTGALVALAPIIRFAGIVIVPVVLAWFLLAGGSWRRRIAFTGAATAAAVAALGAYGLYMSQGADSGTAGVTSWPLYARVAGFADCRKFDPPPGTRPLCEQTPPDERTLTGNDYLYNPTFSPALVLRAERAEEEAAGPDPVNEFTTAVIVNQPLDFAWAIFRDQLRWFDPANPQSGEGQEWEGFMVQMIDGADPTLAGGFGAKIDYRPFFPDPGLVKNVSALEPLRWWERTTRLQGAIAVVLFGLALAAVLLAFSRPGRENALPRSGRVGGLLFAGVAAALAIGPAAILFWQARYGIPVAAPLAAAAGVGAWAIAARVQRRRGPPYADRGATSSA